MESIIKDQLMSYLLSKGLINKHQHAFIKKHSTVTNLLECTHDWAVAIHGGFAVDAILISRVLLIVLFIVNYFINLVTLVSLAIYWRLFLLFYQIVYNV